MAERTAADKVRALEAENERLKKFTKEMLAGEIKNAINFGLEDPINVVKGLIEANEDLVAKVQYLVDAMDRFAGPRNTDHSFTFPDGDTWYVTGHEPTPKGCQEDGTFCGPNGTHCDLTCEGTGD